MSLQSFQETLAMPNFKRCEFQLSSFSIQLFSAYAAHGEITDGAGLSHEASLLGTG